MRTTLTGLAATAALLTLVAPAGAAPSEGHEPSNTEKQRGVVMACTGEADGLAAFVELYRNNKYGDQVLVVLDDDPELAGQRNPSRSFVRDGTVRTGVEIDGARARVRGTAVRVGEPIPFYEEYDDDGWHIVDEGFHRALDTDLTISFRGTTVPLECHDAFAYRITTTRTPM